MNRGDARVVLVQGDGAVVELLFELAHGLGVIAHNEVSRQPRETADHAHHEGP